MLTTSTFLRTSVRALALASIGLLPACGGGGGSDASPSGYSVSLSPNPLTGRWNDRFASVDPLTVTARFSPAPTGTVYPVVMMDAPNFETGSVAVRQISESTFEMDLTPVGTLPVGLHTGTLTLKLCKDSQCAAAYDLTGGSLPYELTVVAALAVKLSVNGKPVSNGAGGQVTAYSDDAVTMDISSDDVVLLESAAKVDWVTDTHNQTDNTITVLGSSPTRWKGRISGPANRTGLSVGAIPKDTNQRSAQFDFFIH